MNRFSLLFGLPIAGVLLIAFSSPLSAEFIVRPESFDFTLPLEVAGRATLVLENTEGAIIQYGVTSKIGDGFRATYYANRPGAAPSFGQAVLRRQDARIDFNWANGGPGNGVPNDSFGVRWEGIINVAQAGEFAFRTITDEGVRLFLDGQRIINDWNNHAATPNDWAGNITSGPHRLRMDYYEDRQTASAQLFWTPPGGQRVIMPGQSEAGWITFNPSRGNIAAGSSVNVQVTVETELFEVGNEYTDTLFITSSDRNNPLVRVPVTLSVTPWQPGAVEPSAWGVARNMQANARESTQLILRSVGRGNYEYTAAVIGNDRGWLTVSPVSGSIGPGLQGTLTLAFNSTARNAGIYTVVLRLTGNDEQNPVTEIPITMSVGIPFGTVSGHVSDFRTEEAVGGAQVGMDGYGFVTVANEDGNFEFSVPRHTYRLWATAPDYVRFLSDEFDVAEGQRIEINPGLRFATFNPVVPDIDMTVAPDDTVTFPLSVRNRGNGVLSWTGKIVFPVEAQFAEWTQRLRFNISREGLEDNRINGVEFIDGNFYVSGGNEGRGFGKIYVFDREGEFVRDFDQFLEGTAFGMRDLAWDGELLWGSDAGVMYGFTLDGELVTQFNGPINPCRALAFDPETGTFWIANISTDLYRVDREGQVIQRIGNPGGSRYGMAWYANDPDGFPLYMLANDNVHYMQVFKYSPTSNQLRAVVDLEAIPADRAGGLGITGEWDPYSWTLLAQMNSGTDAVAVYQMDSRTDWIELISDRGTIDPGRVSDIAFLIDANDLVVEAEYEATAEFKHDGLEGSLAVPITVVASHGRGVAQRTSILAPGWNLISTNVTPEGADDFAGILSPLTEEGSLILAKDGSGNFFWPSRNFNNIDSWDPLQGYWLKVSARTSIRFSGAVVALDTPVRLAAGWNTISYLPRIPSAPDVALGDLGENLIILREGSGRFYLPAYNFMDIEVMREGVGYQLKVGEAGELVYNLNGNASTRKPRYTQEDRDWLKTLPATGSMHNLLAQTSLEAGTHLEALTPAGVIAGLGIVGDDGLAGLTLWGDDPSTSVCEGFEIGQSPVIRLAGAEKVIEYSLKDGSDQWIHGGWGVVTLAGTVLPTEFALSAAYPNPFNSALHISFSLAESGMTSLRVFDLSGREAGTLISSELKAGLHNAEWNADGLSSGIYVVRLEAGSKIASQKVLLLK